MSRSRWIWSCCLLAVGGVLAVGNAHAQRPGPRPQRPRPVVVPPARPVAPPPPAKPAAAPTPRLQPQRGFKPSPKPAANPGQSTSRGASASSPRPGVRRISPSSSTAGSRGGLPAQGSYPSGRSTGYTSGAGGGGGGALGGAGGGGGGYATGGRLIAQVVQETEEEGEEEEEEEESLTPLPDWLLGKWRTEGSSVILGTTYVKTLTLSRDEEGVDSYTLTVKVTETSTGKVLRQTTTRGKAGAEEGDLTLYDARGKPVEVLQGVIQLTEGRRTTGFASGVVRGDPVIWSRVARGGRR